MTYLRSGYLAVNNCSVFTVAPMIVRCNVTNVTKKSNLSNGSITLGITGGTTPYTIRWTYPNGQTIQGGQTIGNLSVGTYTASVTDYYGDFMVTTSCTVGAPPTTTTTSTTTVAPPFEEYTFCLTVLVEGPNGRTSTSNSFYFIPNGTMNGYPKWISSPSGQEIVYYNPLIPNNGGWSVSGSSTSFLTTNNIVIFNSNPTYPPIPGININFTGWTIIYPSTTKGKVSVKEGSCT